MHFLNITHKVLGPGNHIYNLDVFVCIYYVFTFRVSKSIKYLLDLLL